MVDHRLALQAVDDDDSAEIDSEAEDAILSAFARTRQREKTEVAAVEIRRYQNIPQRDAGGKLLLADGHKVFGPLVLYFRRLEPGTLMSMRDEFTVKKPVRRAGRVQFDEAFDNDGFTTRLTYLAMLPWCRTMYFDNSKLWGDEAVGTGEEFLRARLNLGELSYCVDAINQLEGLGEEQADKLGKHLNTADGWTSG